MKITLACAPNGHYRGLMSDLARGIALAGDEAIPTTPAQAMASRVQADAFVCWGWRHGKRVRQVHRNLPVLIMERGYVGDRFHWTSLGWNGLNGRAIFPRPRANAGINYATKEMLIHEGTITPWRTREGEYALILGQVQGDQACQAVNLPSQYRAWSSLLTSTGMQVRYRPHPKALHQRSGLEHRQHTAGTLAEDLAGAKFTISWNSNSSVDSVLAGVPSVTLDRGAMAWAVTSHDLNNPVTMPSRTEWAAQLAWCQWQPSELADGSAWRAVRECMP